MTEERHVPDYLEPLVGYREWGVNSRWLLTGVSVGEVWLPGEPLKAVCHNRDGGSFLESGHEAHVDYRDGHWRRLDAPILHCRCGIYALAEPKTEHERGRVWGAVNLWGRVIVHDDGYRAEYAYPKELFTYDAAWVAPLRREYQVPVTLVPWIDRPQDALPGFGVGNARFGFAGFALVPFVAGGGWASPYPVDPEPSRI